jgi:hypothetical protein
MTYFGNSEGSQAEKASSISQGWLAAQQRTTVKDRIIRVASNEELQIIRLLARRLSLHNGYKNDQARFDGNRWLLAGQEAAEYSAACKKWNVKYLFPPEILSTFDELVYQMAKNPHLPLYQQVGLVEKSNQKRKPEVPAETRAQISFLFNYISPYGLPTTVSATQPIIDGKFLEVWIDLRYKQERLLNNKSEPQKGALNRDLDDWISVWKQSFDGKTDSKFDGQAVHARRMASDLLLMHINLSAPKTRVIYPQLKATLTHHLSSYQGNKIEPPKLHLEIWESCFEAYDLTENQRLTEEKAAFRIGIQLTTLHERKKKAYEIIYGEPYVAGLTRRRRHINEVLPCANCTGEICSKSKKACTRLENWHTQFTLPLDTKNPNRFETPSKHKNAKPDEERAVKEIRDYLSYPPTIFEWDGGKRNPDSDYVPPKRQSFVWHSPEAVEVFWYTLKGQCFDQKLSEPFTHPKENFTSGRWAIPYNFSVPYAFKKVTCVEEERHPVDQFGRCKHLKKRDRCSICAPTTSSIFKGEKEQPSDSISDLKKIKHSPLYLSFYSTKKSILKLTKAIDRSVKEAGERRYSQVWEQTVSVMNKWGMPPLEVWRLQSELQRQYLKEHRGKVNCGYSEPKLSTRRATGFVRGIHGPKDLRTTYTLADLNKLFSKENLPDRTFIGEIFREQAPRPQLDYKPIKSRETKRELPTLIENTQPLPDWPKPVIRVDNRNYILALANSLYPDPTRFTELAAVARKAATLSWDEILRSPHVTWIPITYERKKDWFATYPCLLVGKYSPDLPCSCCHIMGSEFCLAKIVYRYRKSDFL